MSLFGESVSTGSESGAGAGGYREAEGSQSGSSSLESVAMPPSVRSDDRSALRYAEHVYSKLCIGETETLSVKAHRSAVQRMLQLRNFMFESPSDIGRDVRMLLLYAGVSVQRRIALGSEGEEQSDLSVTLVLLFVLQVLSGGPVRSRASAQMESEHCGSRAQHPGLTAGEAPCAIEAPPQPTASEDLETIEQWRTLALVKLLQSSSSDWEAALRLSPSAVCRACIGDAARLGATRPSLAQLTERARLFFRCSALSFQYSMLEADVAPTKSGGISFLTLSSAEFMAEANPAVRAEKLAAIVDAAESEAGQQILRDTILSFVLPQHIVGVRRTPLLGREANRLATEQHPALLAAAHEAAMRGAEWSWAEDPEPLHKMAALLAGLCILMAGRGETGDLLRKKDAFAGRVMLPFLETEPPPPSEKRLGYVPHRNEWLVYTMNRSGKPIVELRHAGLEGLSTAALLLTASRKRPVSMAF